MSRSKAKGVRTTIKTILYENNDGGVEFINFINELKKNGNVVLNEFVRNALRHYYFHLQYSHSAADIAKFFKDSSLIAQQNSVPSHVDFVEQHVSPTQKSNTGAHHTVDATQSASSVPDIPAHSKTEDKGVDLSVQDDDIKIEDADVESSYEHTVIIDDNLAALLALDDDDIP